MINNDEYDISQRHVAKQFISSPDTHESIQAKITRKLDKGKSSC